MKKNLKRLLLLLLLLFLEKKKELSHNFYQKTIRERVL